MSAWDVLATAALRRGHRAQGNKLKCSKSNVTSIQITSQGHSIYQPRIANLTQINSLINADVLCH